MSCVFFFVHHLNSKCDMYNYYYIYQGTSKTEAMALDVSMMSSDFQIKWNVFKPMHNLSYLKIYRHSRGLESRREDLILENKWNIPHKLRFLHWDAYPFTTLSTSISPDSLVELNLCYSKLKRLWSGTPVFYYFCSLLISLLINASS